MSDLGTQYYLGNRETDLQAGSKIKRAEASLPHLAALNEYVAVKVVHEDFLTDLNQLSVYQVKTRRQLNSA